MKTGRGGDLGEVQRVSSVNKCKRFQKANKEPVVAAEDTQKGVFQHSGHNQIRARKWKRGRVIKEGSDVAANDTQAFRF